MNVEILLETINELKNGESIYQIASYLSQVTQSLQTLSQVPQDQRAQQNLSESLKSLEAHLKDRSTNLTPKQKMYVGELGGLKFFSEALVNEIRTSIAENPITPAVSFDVAKQLENKRAQYIQTLEQVSDGLAELGFSATDLGADQAEIGFEIPRKIFENDFGGLIDELRVTKFVVDTASLLKTGQRSGIELSQLSTSDPLFILGLDPKIIGMIGAFVTWALHTWKQAEEIRALRRTASSIPDLDEVAAALEQKVDERIKNAIDEKVEEITTAEKKKSNKEIVNMTQRSLRLVLERVERGMTIQIRLPDYSEAVDANDEANSHEPTVNDRLYELRDELVFPSASANPILQLTHETDDQDDKQL